MVSFKGGVEGGGGGGGGEDCTEELIVEVTDREGMMADN